MQEEAVIEREIVIGSAQREVFDFVAAYSNDPLWRAEVKRFDYAKPVGLGAVITEHSEFQGASLETVTTVVEWEPPYRATVETAANAPHHLINTRTVTAVGTETSLFTYRLAFDREILRPVMPQLPSAEEISAWYGDVVMSYLENLKKIIEAD